MIGLVVQVLICLAGIIAAQTVPSIKICRRQRSRRKDLPFKSNRFASRLDQTRLGNF
jgi:hypothetical protein